MKPFIKSEDRTNWATRKETVAQPNGIDYQELLKSIQNIDNKNLNKENFIIRKDLRKVSKDEKHISYELNENDDVNKLDKSSIIPIPGLMVEYDQNESGYSPPSHWNNPTLNNDIGGVQWNPMTMMF